jgi:hypothetical protein
MAHRLKQQIDGELFVDTTYSYLHNDTGWCISAGENATTSLSYGNGNIDILYSYAEMYRFTEYGSPIFGFHTPKIMHISPDGALLSEGLDSTRDHPMLGLGTATLTGYDIDSNIVNIFYAAESVGIVERGFFVVNYGNGDMPKYQSYKNLFDTDSLSKFYKQYYRVSSITPRMFFAGDNGYVIQSEFVVLQDSSKPQSYTHVPLLMGFDKDWNLLWEEHTYYKATISFGTASSSFHTAKNVGDTLYVVGVPSGSDVMTIRKINMLSGEIIAESAIPSHSCASIVIAPNEEIILAGNKLLYENDGDSYRNWYAAKLNKDFSLKWEKYDSSEKAERVYFHNAEILSDTRTLFYGSGGDIVLFGVVIGEEVGIEDEDNANISGMTVSSNPTSDLIHVSLTIPYTEHLRISLFNMLGNELLVIHDGIAESGTFDIEASLGHLPAGVYYIKSEYRGGTQIEKIVKY